MQQRGDDCANVAVHVLRSIVEKYPVYFTPEVWVQGVLKGVALKRPEEPVLVDLFARTFELRSSDKAFTQRIIKYGVEKIRQEPAEEDLSDVASTLATKCFLLTILSSLPYANEELVTLIVTQTGEAGVQIGTTCLAALENMLESLEMTDDEEVIRACEEASRSYLLLESKRFLASTYKNVLASTGKVTLPLDIPHLDLTVPFNQQNQDMHKSLQECYNLLEHALHVDSNEAARSARKTPATKERARRDRDADADLFSSDSEPEQTPTAARSRVPGSASSRRSALPRSTKKADPPRTPVISAAARVAMELDDGDDDNGASDGSTASSDDEWE